MDTCSRRTVDHTACPWQWQARPDMAARTSRRDGGSRYEITSLLSLQVPVLTRRITSCAVPDSHVPVPSLLAYSASTMFAMLVCGRRRSGHRARAATLRTAALGAALACAVANTANAQAVDGDLRLVEGHGEVGSGRVEGPLPGRMGHSLRRLLGHRRCARRLPTARIPRRTFEHLIKLHPTANRTVLLDDLQCAGTEAKLVDCPRSAWKHHNCHFREGAGVRCDPTGTVAGIYATPTILEVTEARAPQTYAVRLFKEPSGNVTVTAATVSSAISLSPTSLTLHPLGLEHASKLRNHRNRRRHLRRPHRDCDPHRSRRGLRGHCRTIRHGDGARPRQPRE